MVFLAVFQKGKEKKIRETLRFLFRGPKNLRESETTIKIKFAFFGGGGLGRGAERKIVQNAIFHGKRHDNRILKVKILLSRTFVVMAQAPKIASDFFCDFFCDSLAIFLRFLRQHLRFSTLRFENEAIFLRLRFFGTLRNLVSHYRAIGDTILCDAPYSAIGSRGKFFLRCPPC